MDQNDPRLAAQLRKLNVNAPTFVPSVEAQPFVPGMHYGQGPGTQGYPGYAVGPPQGYGSYSQVPYTQRYPQQGQGMQFYQYNRPPPHYTAQPPSTQASYTSRGGSSQPETSQVATVGQELQVTADEPVESWEDIASEEPEVKSSSPSCAAVLTAVNSISSGETASELKHSNNITHDSHEVTASVVAGKLEGSPEPVTSAPQEPPRDKSKVKPKQAALSDQRSQSAEAKSKASQSLPEKDNKENLNIIFIGHVDAGKSTIGGQLMYLTGQVDKRTLEKFEREAKAKNRETWYLSWALDLNPEERDKGKTVEVGRAYFETEKKRFHILDAPGHAGFVPNMIGGAAQADIGILVISARKGEFETGFEKGGQTREHTVLVKTAGAKHLVVLINKMDDQTVNWSQERFEECKTKLTPFLKKVGFNPVKDVHFIPVSGYLGTNLKDTDQNASPFYTGLSFLDYLNSLSSLSREDTGPVRLPILDRFKDMGTFVIGKLEAGTMYKGQQLLMMPNKVAVEVLMVQRNEQEITKGFCGDNLKVKLKGIEEDEIASGFVLCEPDSYCHVGRTFDAQIVILESKSIICAGYNAVMHLHTLVEEVEIKALLAIIDKKSGRRVQSKPRFVKQDQTVIAKFDTSGMICMESFNDFPQMARFTLRDEGRTIAIGKILKVIE